MNPRRNSSRRRSRVCSFFILASFLGFWAARWRGADMRPLDTAIVAMVHDTALQLFGMQPLIAGLGNSQLSRVIAFVILALDTY